MSRLLAVVTHAFTLGFGGAIAGNVSNFTAVVALLAISAVASHVAEAATRVASLLTAAKATAIAATLGTVSRDMADPATLVALLTTTSSAVALARASLRTFARNVTSGSTTIA